MMTHQVDPHEQGRLQGALTSLASLAGIFGPAMFANIFALFISDHAPVSNLSGAAFLLAGLLLIVAIAIATRVTRHAPAAATWRDEASTSAALPGELSPIATTHSADLLSHEPPEHSP